MGAGFSIDFINVVFPAPFSPIRPTITPFGIFISNSPNSNLSSYFFFKFLMCSMSIFSYVSLVNKSKKSNAGAFKS